MEVHPAASIVPVLDGTAYEALKSDIQANGQQVPVVLWMGKVLDGRNRLRACQELRIAPKLQELSALPANSPTTYVLSMNLHRRHLSPSQLAMVGARAREHFDAEAKLRQAKRVPTTDVRGDARDLAGRAVGVSGKTIDYACKVLKGGIPEVVAACDSGKLTVSKASRLVDLPANQQLEAVASGKREVVASPRRGSTAGFRSQSARFDQLVLRAREVQHLVVGQLGSARTLIESGHFDRAVMLTAIRQLEAVSDALSRWTQDARSQLALEDQPLRKPVSVDVQRGVVRTSSPGAA